VLRGAKKNTDAYKKKADDEGKIMELGVKFIEGEIQNYSENGSYGDDESFGSGNSAK
jgi:hypothetical protein